MAKVQIKSEKLTPFGGFFPIMEPSPSHFILGSPFPHPLLATQPVSILFPHPEARERDETSAENGGYPPTQNGDIRSLFWLFSLMALQN